MLLIRSMVNIVFFWHIRGQQIDMYLIEFMKVEKVLLFDDL